MFELIRNVSSCEALLPEGTDNVSPSKVDSCKQMVSGKDHRSKSVPFEMYKTRTTVEVRRETFLDVVCDALAEYKYVGPNQRADLVLACRYVILYLSEIKITHTALKKGGLGFIFPWRSLVNSTQLVLVTNLKKCACMCDILAIYFTCCLSLCVGTE